MGAANVNIARHRFRELEWVLKGLVIPYGRVGVGKYSSLVVSQLKGGILGVAQRPMKALPHRETTQLKADSMKQ